MFPRVTIAMLDDLQQTCYLGAVPISFETVGTGLVIFYSGHKSADYVAQVFFWIAVLMTLVVTTGGVYSMYRRQGRHTMNDVTGAWFLLFIPMIVGAAFGSNLANAVSLKNGTAVIVVSFLMLSLGIGLSFLVLGIYLWRLMSCQLPPRESIVSTFVPVGPPSMAAYTLVNLSVALARNVVKNGFLFGQSFEPAATQQVQTAVAEIIIWIGVIGALFLLGVASFFLIEAVAAVATTVPKTFNIGLWSFVFPCGVYANAFCRLSKLLRNEGMKGWATFCVVCTISLWMMCAVLTTYKAIIQGKLFFAPGLQGGWIEKAQLEQLSKDKGLSRDKTLESFQSLSCAHLGQSLTRRQPSNDGSYEPNASSSHDV